ncbi:MAG: ABC transporter substrate-binding protein [Oscillospiraceae bacterium]|nr:ABC transporter substrate-binding protein [Oscillospiraceae bacterium]
MKRIKLCLLALALTACTAAPEIEVGGYEEMALEYAEHFSVLRYDNYDVIDIDGERYYLADDPSAVTQTDGTVIGRPHCIYVAASSAMDLFRGAEALDTVSMTSTEADKWTIPEIKTLVESEDIAYVGKYNAPDFEYLLSENCDLAVESTMIYHSPKTEQMLEEIGIPVMTEHSSYESHPLGRLEWVRLYGVLTGHEAEADAFFEEKRQLFESVAGLDETGKSAAFFYLTNGRVNIRKPGDYVSRMIELAGGRYIFTPDMLNVDENSLSTMTIGMESFYTAAADADVLIYNSTIAGQTDIAALLDASPVMADMKAVRSGDVWCTEADMFQRTASAAEIINEFHLIMSGEAEDEMEFFHRIGDKS